MIDDFQRMKLGMDLFIDPPEFEVGQTPSEVVYTKDKLRLLHYEPRVRKPEAAPVLIVYALVNRYYILDLQPDRSVVKNLLDEGLDVYIIDWGYPAGPDRYLTIDDYVNDYIDSCVDKIREWSSEDQISLLGVCQGGTFSLMYSALHPEKVKNLVTLVAPGNFDTEDSLLNIWAKSLDIDSIVDYHGIIPGDFLNAGFLLTDPFRLMIDKYLGIFDRLESDAEDEEGRRKNEATIQNFLRMEKWIFDSPAQAGETLRQFIKDCYQDNLLIKNEMEIGGQRIDLRNITMPLLNVMGEYDHIVPNAASIPITDAVGSTDKEMAVFKTGHIGMFVGGASQRVVCPKIAGWLKPRSKVA